MTNVRKLTHKLHKLQSLANNIAPMSPPQASTCLMVCYHSIRFTYLLFVLYCATIALFCHRSYCKTLHIFLHLNCTILECRNFVPFLFRVLPCSAGIHQAFDGQTWMVVLIHGMNIYHLLTCKVTSFIYS